MTERWDALVLGAGTPGLVAATVLARGDVRVLVLGDAPGTGGGPGLLTGAELGLVAQGDGGSVPAERRVTEHRWYLLDRRSSLSVVEQEPAEGDPTRRIHTVQQSRMGPWLVERARSAGAELRLGSTADRLLVDPSGTVRGAAVGPQEFPSSMVIQTEALSTGAKGGDLEPRSVRGPVDQRAWVTIAAVAEQLESRFGVGPGGGAVFDAVLGQLRPPAMGRGYVWTHRDAITIGVAVRSPTALDALPILQAFRDHPSVNSFLGAGGPIESGSGGIRSPAETNRPGLLVAGEASGNDFENLFLHAALGPAVRSANLAASAALEGIQAGSDPRSVLRSYRRGLHRAGLDEDHQRSGKASSRVEWNPRLHHEYPRLATELFHRMMTETSQPKEPMARTFAAARKASGVRWTDLAKDGLMAGCSL
jgi:flavin-dependent dehydrogenase